MGSKTRRLSAKNEQRDALSIKLRAYLYQVAVLHSVFYLYLWIRHRKKIRFQALKMSTYLKMDGDSRHPVKTTFFAENIPVLLRI